MLPTRVASELATGGGRSAEGPVLTATRPRRGEASHDSNRATLCNSKSTTVSGGRALHNNPDLHKNAGRCTKSQSSQVTEVVVYTDKNDDTALKMMCGI